VILHRDEFGIACAEEVESGNEVQSSLPAEKRASMTFMGILTSTRTSWNLLVEDMNDQVGCSVWRRGRRNHCSAR